MFACVLHRQGRKFVGDTHALDFLCGLDGASFVKQWRTVNHVARNLSEGVKEILSGCGWLANHTIGTLSPHVEFHGDLIRETALLEHFESEIEGPILRRTRITLVITFEQPNISRP